MLPVSALLLGPTQNQNQTRDHWEVPYRFPPQPGRAQLAVQAEQSTVSRNMQGVGELIVRDNYLSGRRNRVNSRWRGSGSWIRRWKAGGRRRGLSRRRRLSRRQAFREQFILHRTETEESDCPGDGTVCSPGCSPCLRVRGGEATCRPTSRDQAEASLSLEPGSAVWLLATFSAPTPLSDCNSWSRSILLLPVSASEVPRPSLRSLV